MWTGFSTSAGQYEADVVVLAAGLNVPKLAKELGGNVSLSDKPGTLTILTQPMPKFLNHIIVTGLPMTSLQLFCALINQLHRPSARSDDELLSD